MNKTFVPPEGNISTANYVIVGEQPGHKEVRYGRPFVGPAGRELSEDLQIARINRTAECYLTNVMKDLDKPLEHYIKFGRAEPLLSKEGVEYLRILENELKEAKPTAVFIPTGNVALYALTSRTGITRWRGSVVKTTLGTGNWCVPIVHPATVLPPKNVYLNKILIQYDLTKARRIYEEGFTPPLSRFSIRPSSFEITTFLQACYDKGGAGHTIDYDIEVYNSQLSCIAFAYDRENVLCIPFVDAKGDCWSIQEELDFMKMIASILENPNIRKRGQNIAFDSTFLLRNYNIRAVNMDDTMIAQQTLMPEFPKGLDFIASIWTDFPYYKAEGKQFMRAGGAFETLWNYNCTDAAVCAEAFPKQKAALEKRDNLPAYERQRRLIEPLTFMMEHGVKIDVEGMTKRYDEMAIELDAEGEAINQLVGKEINPLSPKQLMNYFYNERGFSAYKNKGRVTTNEIAMKRLSRKGVKEATHVLNYRRINKIRSTYLDPAKIDSDGRIRCSYNPVGTRFSRLSSSENIFGTGNNLQNQPHHVLKYFIADSGYIIYSIDLAQAENRIVAYVGRIDTMIEAFENRLDLHSLTGALISRKTYEEVIDDDRNHKNAPLGSGDKSWRFWGKKANHALNYDLGYRKFSLTYEITERDGKYIVESYHSAYPGIRQGYHTLVRQMLAKDRTIVNLMGRRTLFLDQWGDNLFKDAYSCIPQGTVGDVINERGIEYIYYNQDLFKPVVLLLQVHDSIGFEVPLSLPWVDHAEILLNIKRSLETPLIAHGREFVIPADISMGYNFFKDEMKEIKGPDCPNNKEALAELLQKLNREVLNGEVLHHEKEAT